MQEKFNVRCGDSLQEESWGHTSVESRL